MSLVQNNNSDDKKVFLVLDKLTYIKQLHKISEKRPSFAKLNGFLCTQSPLASKIREACPKGFVDVPLLTLPLLLVLVCH